MKIYASSALVLLLGGFIIGGISSRIPEDGKGVYIESTMAQETTETTTITLYDTSALSNAKQAWYYMPTKDNTPPKGNSSVDLSKYSSYYLGNSTNKEIYLTFDEGYENGYSAKILDTLKEKNIKAAFFVTRPYILSSPELVKRMVEEGHIVGNHSAKHYSSPTLSDADFMKEITDTEEAFKELTGVNMSKFFRPPMGEYSERTLALAHNMGYKSVFWSFAHRDWLTDNQPSVQETYNRVINNSHNGEIMLLHAVSSSNTAALGSIIDELKNRGFEFKTLYDLK